MEVVSKFEAQCCHQLKLTRLCRRPDPRPMTVKNLASLVSVRVMIVIGFKDAKWGRDRGVLSSAVSL